MSEDSASQGFPSSFFSSTVRIFLAIRLWFRLPPAISNISPSKYSHLPSLLLSNSIYSSIVYLDLGTADMIYSSISGGSSQSSCGNRSWLYTIQHFTCFWHQQDPFRFPAFPFIEIDYIRVQVAEVEGLAPFFRNLCCQCDIDARRFNGLLGIISTDSSQVRAVGDDAPRMMFEPIPLLHEIIADVVADFVHHAAVRVADLLDMRRVNDDFPPVFDRGLEFVHSFRRRPNVGIHWRHDRQDTSEWLIDPVDMEFGGKIAGCLPCRFGGTD